MWHAAAAWCAEFRRTKAFDGLAATPLIAWYLLGLWNQAPLTISLLGALLTGKISLLSFSQLVALLGSYVLSYLLIFLLITRDVPRRRLDGILPRAVAVTGAFLGNAFLQLKPAELSLAVQLLADLLIIAGTAGAFVAASRLGRSFSMMPEARRLVTTGPYAVIRHPLYCAELVGVAGLAIQFQQPWAGLLGLGVCGFQFWRTIFEERVLSDAFPEYAEYRARTWRFVPYVL